MVKKIFKNLFKPLFTKLAFSAHNIVNSTIEKQKIENLKNVILFDPNSVIIDKTSKIVNNRDEKKYLSIDSNSWICGELITFKPGGQIAIGKECFIGEGSRIWSSVKIQIGDRVLISHNVNIHDNISHSLNSAERHEEYLLSKKGELLASKSIPEKEIIIHDDVWIGFNATILKGVTVGKGAVVGANTVIVKDVPPYAVVVGNPARIIKYTT